MHTGRGRKWPGGVGVGGGAEEAEGGKEGGREEEEGVGVGGETDLHTPPHTPSHHKTHEFSTFSGRLDDEQQVYCEQPPGGHAQACQGLPGRGPELGVVVGVQGDDSDADEQRAPHYAEQALLEEEK